MIPEGSLYTENTRQAGEIAEHLPSEHIDSHVAEGEAAFGKMVVDGSEAGKAKLVSAASDKPIGVAGYSSQASDLNNEKYQDGDPLAAVREGVVMARVEEAVTPASLVRVRHANEASTKGYQKWGFSAAKNGSSATGLANDAAKAEVTGNVDLSSGHDWSTTNKKTFVIEVNEGLPKDIELDAACANLTEVLAEINSEFVAAGIDGDVEAVASTNYVKLRTKAAGADKKIELAEGTGALAELGLAAGAVTGDDGTEYAAVVKVNGITENISISGSKAQTITTLIAQLAAQLTGATPSFVDADDDIKIESDTTGDGSSIEIVDDDLFSSLTDINAAADAAVPGLGDPDGTLAPGNFCTTAVANKTALVANARFKGTTTGPGLVALWIQGPMTLTADV